MLHKFLIACLLLGFAGIAQGETARGVVFNDANRNGQRDGGEKGLAGVLVSNGEAVVPTDAEGRWSLEAGEDTILFVIKPRNWMTPVNSEQVPQSFYIHKPAGSPALRVPGVSPTGPLPASIDFPLYAREEPEQFTVLLFGDTQARGMREVNFITRDVVEELVGVDAAFGLSLGDIVADDAGLFDEINGSIAQLGIPWYNVFGNHDTNRDGPGDALSDETFERVYGPTYYAFEYGSVAFIVLDNILVRDDGGYDSRFTESQIAFVANYLAHVPQEKLVVLAMHAPLFSTKNAVDLYRLIEQRPHTFSTAAHTHTLINTFITERQGWGGEKPHHHFVNGTVCGSWWCGIQDEMGIPHAVMNDGAPNGYAFASFSGNTYTLRYQAARRPADYQMNIYLPDDLVAASAAETGITVNFFMGNEQSIVEMRLGNEGAWTALAQTRGEDPQNAVLHQMNPFLEQRVLDRPLDEVFGWQMDAPSKTMHLWKGQLPANPPVGTQTITVRATDMFGQVWTAHRIVRFHASVEAMALPVE
ncbi:MAG: calcineurin-like phosphoesterase C-terminal domain-containing protein [Candidatus Hydrogenedentes bacterium]|nr:calcineurin-like phosphoesterase C-terminal domain-containing protein [Candidatus Hydrogenedentota bacterium]